MFTAIGKAWGQVYPHQLATEHITQLTGMWQTYCQATRYCYHQQLRTVLRWLVPYGTNPELIGMVSKVSKPSPRLNTATPSELETLLAAASPAVRLAMLLAAHLCVRSGTIARLTPCEWQRESKTLLFRTKFGRTLALPTTAAIDALLDIAMWGQPQPCTVPFVQLLQGPGIQVTNKWLQLQLRNLKAITGVGRNLTFHDLRRTVAVACYRDNHDLRTVQNLLGHKDASHTLWYLGHQGEPVNAALVSRLANATTEVSDV
jgi:integrase